MINLQPYQNPTYFVLLAAALLPLAIGLLYGKRFKVYEMIVSFAFLLLTFGGVKLNEGLALLGYVILKRCWSADIMPIERNKIPDTFLFWQLFWQLLRF